MNKDIKEFIVCNHYKQKWMQKTRIYNREYNCKYFVLNTRDVLCKHVAMDNDKFGRDFTDRIWNYRNLNGNYQKQISNVLKMKKTLYDVPINY